MAKAAGRGDIGRHGVVVEPAGNDLPEPRSLHGDRIVPAPPEFFLEAPQFCPYPVAPGFPPKQEAAAPCPPADMREPQEVEKSVRVWVRLDVLCRMRSQLAPPCGEKRAASRCSIGPSDQQFRIVSPEFAG
jgi:hypothetical protein